MFIAIPYFALKKIVTKQNIDKDLDCFKLNITTKIIKIKTNTRELKLLICRGLVVSRDDEY